MRSFLYAFALSVCTAVVGINGAGAAEIRTLTLKWAPNSQPVTGYEVYYGTTADPKGMRALFVPQDLNLKAPAVKYDVLRDLQAQLGQEACFRVKAYNNTAKSAFSNAVCTRLIAEAEKSKAEKKNAEKRKAAKRKAEKRKAEKRKAEKRKAEKKRLKAEQRRAEKKRKAKKAQYQ